MDAMDVHPPCCGYACRYDLLIGDAAFTTEVYHHPEMEELPDAQETDRSAWAASLSRIRQMRPSRVHFCHDTALAVPGTDQ